MENGKKIPFAKRMANGNNAAFGSCLHFHITSCPTNLSSRTGPRKLENNKVILAIVQIEIFT